MGIGGIGGLADVGTRRFLKAKGIDPKEVTFIVLGGSAVRMAAVMSCSVAAAPLLHFSHLSMLLSVKLISS